MPLLRKRPYDIVGTLNSDSKDEPMFVFAYTGEVFDTYEEYRKKLFFYKEKIWSCKYTGKSNLSYAEAYHCECDVLKTLRKFPLTHLKALIEIVHNSNATLDELTDMAYRRFSWEFMPGEEGYAVRRGDIIHVKVVSLEKRPSESEIENLPFPNLQLDAMEAFDSNEKPASESELMSTSTSALLSKFVYKVEAKSLPVNIGPPGNSSIITVTGASLSRKRPAIDKVLIRLKIRQISQRAQPMYGRWIVQDEFIKESGVDASGLLSTSDSSAKKRKLSSDGGELVDADGADELTKEQKREIMKTEANERRHKKKEEIKAQRIQLAEEKRAQKFEERKKKRDALKVVRYPMEDSLVPESERKDEGAYPTLSRDFGVDSKDIGSLIMVWNFINTFSRTCKITPFALDDLVEAISMKEKTPLISSLYSQLLKFALSDYEGDEGKSVTVDNWEAKLTKFIQRPDSEFDDFYKIKPDHRHVPNLKFGYSHLKIQKKICLLEFLIQKALETNELRLVIDSNIEKISEIRQEARDQDISDRRELLEDKGNPSDNEESCEQKKESKPRGKPKSLKAYEREQRDTEEYERRNKTRNEQTKKELAKYAVRHLPIGHDREHQRYWNFGDGRIFVEGEPNSPSWGFYEHPEEVQELKLYLNEKGIREQKLKRNVTEDEDKIAAAMRKRMQEMESNIESHYTRRSTRTKQPQKQRPCMTYFNKLA